MPHLWSGFNYDFWIVSQSGFEPLQIPQAYWLAVAREYARGTAPLISCAGVTCSDSALTSFGTGSCSQLGSSGGSSRTAPVCPRMREVMTSYSCLPSLCSCLIRLIMSHPLSLPRHFTFVWAMFALCHDCSRQSAPTDLR